MFIKNCWYVAAWGHEVPTDGLFRRVVIDIPLALWRDSAGKVVALDDRCCHRGASLSMGHKEGDHVRCAYHGLLYDRAGKCVAAPAQTKIQPQLKVQSFPVVEQHTWVWVWMGDPELADPALIPDAQWLDHPEWRSIPGYLHYGVNYLLIADNLLDFSHLPFLHKSTLGGSPDYAAVLPKVERMERGVRQTKFVYDTEPPPYSRGYGDYPAGCKADRWMIYDTMVPCILLMDFGLMRAGTGLNEGRRDGALKFRSCQALTPETENSTHYFFSQCHNFKTDDPEVTKALHQSVIVAFEEDRSIISSQARNMELNPDFKMEPLTVDAALNQFRWVVKQLIRKEQPQEAQA